MTLARAHNRDTVPLKLRFEIFPKLSHTICSNFAIIDQAIMAGLKKLLVQRNTKINKTRNGVITLPWRPPIEMKPRSKEIFIFI